MKVVLFKGYTDHISDISKDFLKTKGINDFNNGFTHLNHEIRYDPDFVNFVENNGRAIFQNNRGCYYIKDITEKEFYIYSPDSSVGEFIEIIITKDGEDIMIDGNKINWLSK